MNPRHLARKAQALVTYKVSGGEQFTPAWLVDVLEKMPGVTPHAADQAAARALASSETAEAVANRKAFDHYTNNTAALAAALRAAADQADKKGL